MNAIRFYMVTLWVSIRTTFRDGFRALPAKRLVAITTFCGAMLLNGASVASAIDFKDFLSGPDFSKLAGFVKLFSFITGFLAAVLLVVSFVVILISAIKFATSGRDIGKHNEAMKGMRNGLVGIVIGVILVPVTLGIYALSKGITI